MRAITSVDVAILKSGRSSIVCSDLLAYFNDFGGDYRFVYLLFSTCRFVLYFRQPSGLVASRIMSDRDSDHADSSGEKSGVDAGSRRRDPCGDGRRRDCNWGFDPSELLKIIKETVHESVGPLKDQVKDVADQVQQLKGVKRKLDAYEYKAGMSKRAKTCKSSDDDIDDALSINEEGEISNEDDDDDEEVILKKQQLYSPPMNRTNSGDQASGSAEATESSAQDLIDEMEKVYEGEDAVGANIEQSLANLIERRTDKKQDDKGLKLRMDKLPRPGNTGHAQIVPSVNKQIWRKVPEFVQSQDLKLAFAQKAIVKASIAVSKLTNDLLCPGKLDHKDKLKCGFDALSLLGAATREVSFRRRFYLRNFTGALRDHWEDATVAPVTGKLYGDNLVESTDKAKKLNKLIAKQAFLDRKKGFRKGPRSGKERRDNRHRDRDNHKVWYPKNNHKKSASHTHQQ